MKYYSERSKYLVHPGVEFFSFQHEVKGMCISKKQWPRVEISPWGGFHLAYV